MEESAVVVLVAGEEHEVVHRREDAAAGICTTMSPRLVLKVASQTEVVGMHGGGALVNQTMRLVDPVAGGHVVAAAAVANGWVVGVGNVVTVLAVVVVVVVVVFGGGVFAVLLPEPFTKSTMPTMMAASTKAPIPRRVLRRLLRFFWMTACFCSRAARCRALFSVGTDRKATDPHPKAHTRAPPPRARRARRPPARAGRSPGVAARR